MIDIEKRNKRQYEWQKKSKERINILFDPGTKDRIKAAADKLHISASDFIRQAINEKIDKVDQDPEAKKINEDTKYY